MMKPMKFKSLPPPPAAAAPMALNSVWDYPIIEIMEETTAIGNIKKSWKCLAPSSNKIWSGLNNEGPRSWI